MDSSTYNRLQAIVEDALASDEPAERVHEICRDDVALAERALELLALVTEDDGLFSSRSIDARRRDLEEALSVDGARDAWSPKSIGPYVVERLLGHGGTGVVFLARQPGTERHVAVKLLHPLFATAGLIERLRKEAKILGSLSHPGIAQIFETGAADLGFGEQHYLAMEWIDGPDVVTYARAPQLGLRDRIGLVARIATALVHAHERGVVHRDLKPDNVLVAPDGTPKVLDFSIAALWDEGVDARATRDTDVLGTLAYMAPEQATSGSRAPSPLSDVYSLGAIAYEIVTGRPPREVRGLSITEALREIEEISAPPARAVDPTVPRDVETILGKALESRPEARYASVAALRTDLERFLGDRPIHARPPSALDRALKFTRRHRTLVGGAAATFVALVAGVVVAAVLAHRARLAEGDAQFQRYAAEMLIATSRLMDPVTRGRSREIVERWAPETGVGRRVDERTGLRWEWHLVRSVERAEVVRLPSEYPTDVAWHPSGDRVAVCTNRSVAVFDADGGPPLAEMEVDLGPEGVLFDVQWSRAGDVIAFGGQRGVGVWEPELGSTPRWVQPTQFTPEIAWSADGTTLLTLGDDAALFDVEDGQRLWNSPGRLYPLNGIGVSHTRGAFLVQGPEDALYWLDAAGGSLERALPGLPKLAISLALSPDESEVAVGYVDGSFVVHGLADQDLRLSVKAHRERIFEIAWSPDGQRIATASDDGTLRLFDSDDGAVFDAFEIHRSSARTVAWSPDGKRLASTAWLGEACVLAVGEGAAVRQLASADGFEDLHRYMTVDAASRRLIASQTYGARSIDLEGGRVSDVTSVSGQAFLAPDGERVASPVRGNTVVVATLDGERTGRVEIGADTTLVVEWLPTGDGFVAANRSGLWVIDVDGVEPGPPRWIADIEGQAQDVAVSPDGTRAAVPWTTDAVGIVDLATGATLRIEGGGRLGTIAVSWSPDGRAVALACNDTTLRLHDASTGAPLWTLRGHASPVSAVAWHPSGDRIASGSRDRTVKIWDPASGLLVGSMELEDHVVGLVWVHGGAALAALDSGGRVVLFDARRSLGGR